MIDKEEILQDMNNCQSTCKDIQATCNEKKEYKDLDWLIANLPGLEYTKTRFLNYMFSNGMSSGVDSEDKRLNAWLYEQKNDEGSTNYSVLRDAIGDAATYGECGLRMYNGNLYSIPTKHYGILYTKGEGVKRVIAYYMRKDTDVVEEVSKDEWSKFQTIEQIKSWFDRKGLILLDPSEFVNVRNDTTFLHGKNPFSTDRQRLALLMSVYRRLNYDIEYDGPGRIIVRPRAAFSEDNETSTSAIIENGNEAAVQKRYDDALKEISRVSRQIKESSSDSVIALSNGFADKIEHLPRVTKATEFFDWIHQEGLILAQIYGMSPVLLEAGEWSGNVSMAAIIDTAMLNTIVPMREMYAIQFSSMIARELGISKVYFNKYEMKQIQDDNESRQKMASAIRDLSYAMKNNPNSEVERLITDFAKVMQTTLYDDNGNLITL